MRCCSGSTAWEGISTSARTWPPPRSDSGSWRWPEGRRRGLERAPLASRGRFGSLRLRVPFLLWRRVELAHREFLRLLHVDVGGIRRGRPLAARGDQELVL